MVSALIISNNFDFVKNLINEISSNNLNIKIAKIVTNKVETQTILNMQNFDIIFLDKSLENIFNNLFLEIYKSSIILLSYNNNSNLFSIPIKKQIDELINRNDFDDKRSKIVKELEYIGYKFNYNGTLYLIDAILLMYRLQNKMIDNLEGHIYPIIAQKYNKSVCTIKSSINRANENMYCECDFNKLSSYFKLCSDTKPSIKRVIFTIINKIA